MKKKMIFICLSFILIILGIITEVMPKKVYADNSQHQEIPESYDLRDYIDITVKDQYKNPKCVPVSISTMIESYIRMQQLNGRTDLDFANPVFSMLTLNPYRMLIPIEESEKVIESFYNGEIKTEDELLAKTGEINNLDLQLEVEKIIPKYQILGEYDSPNTFTSFSRIRKSIEDNNIEYRDDYNNIISKEEVNSKRNEYKKYIMENGGIHTDIYSGDILPSKNIESGKAIKVCNSKKHDSSHAVVIIGWDDNFSRFNFPERIRPTSDGAYLIQNSWGASWGEKGTFYVSYEDVNIERAMNGIKKVVVADLEKYDTSSPYIKLEQNEDKTIIRVSDKNGIGVDYFKYMYTTGNEVPDIQDNRWTLIKDNRAEIMNESGKNLWVYAIDKNENDVMTMNGTIVHEYDNVTESRILKIDKIEQSDGSYNIEAYYENSNEVPQIRIVGTNISDEEIEANHIIENNKHIINISKYGRCFISIYEQIDGEENFIESIEVNRRDKTRADISYSIEAIDNTKSKLKLIIKGQDLESGIRLAGVAYVEGKHDEITEKELSDGKAEFELTQNGDYIIYVQNGSGLHTYVNLTINEIVEDVVEDNSENNIPNSENNLSDGEASVETDKRNTIDSTHLNGEESLSDFSVVNNENNNENMVDLNNPKTGDRIFAICVILGVALIMFLFGFKRKNDKSFE